MKKKQSKGQNVQLSIDRLSGVVESVNKKLDNGIHSCIALMESLNIEDEEFFYDCLYMLTENKDARIMLLGLSDPKRQMGYLKRMVSATIMFDRGTMSCLKYLEAVPWSEHEEEKLKSLFSRCPFDESVAEEVLARLRPEGSGDSGELAAQLIRSVANGTNSHARKELQTLVNGLLSKSSVYSKELAGLSKDSLYSICATCVKSLTALFEEASSSAPAKEPMPRPLIERISKQVENLNWLLDILVDRRMAADFIRLWAAQDELLRLHERTSSMIRYELSRISASVFMAMGGGKVQCRGDIRHAVLRGWFRPLLLDFGWIQRCSKGLDVRMLEEGLGQAILTLPMKQQQALFVEWFQFFGAQGTECPNLSKAFQVWWRRSFARSFETLS